LPGSRFAGGHGSQTGRLTKFNQKWVTILGDNQRQWRVTLKIVEPIDGKE
jgi:hypothetical protein